MARLTVPLEAVGIDGLDPKQPIKVLLASAGRPLASRTVTLDPKGSGAVNFDFDRAAGGLRVLVGPADATDDEMLGLQTLSVDVPLRRFLGKDELAIAPLRITPFYWFWWLRWCRTFTVRGRVLCRDGSPAPGAVVCAYDVDAWWWWWSQQQLGCATTDASGSFTMTFRWCCGWWPWYWWSLRRWQVEPWLAQRLLQGLQREPRIPKIPLPDPAPDLGIFERLLGDAATLPATQRGLARAMMQGKALTRGVRESAPLAAARAMTSRFQPERLEGLREKLVATLPTIADLSALRLWPWAPWQPWWDCTPDLVFRATQRCGGEERLIVDEGWFQARWNVPTELDVTLTANERACCIPVNDCVEGHCLALAQVCSIDADDIGGNTNADPAPVGYARPNLVANNGDAPFAGVVEVHGTVQCLADVDYYEIEYSQDETTWTPVPPNALGGFVRKYWDFALGHDADAYFSATPPLDGRNVYETVAHYEATHTPGDWGVSKVWLGTNIDLVFPWLTDGSFSDGTYWLRVRGYDEAGGVLSGGDPLDVCETGTEARIVVTLDNQSSFPAPGPADNPCGPGTTHACTNEPMTDILDVRIVKANGVSQAVGPCGQVRVEPGDMLEVDFAAYDAQGHLASFDLIATYGENEAVPLTALGGVGALSPLPGAPVPAAAQVGPDYALARAQGAMPPTWAGGALRFSLSATAAFPESCCYQLELRAYKRTIVNCGNSAPHQNLSERSFQVSV
jgi:hypothetical protein